MKGLTLTPRQRLTLLAAYLRTIPEDNFDLSSWAIFPERNEDMLCVEKPAYCGTTACACGHATTLFDELSLVMLPCSRVGAIQFNGTWGWIAVQEFFEMPSSEMFRLFSREAYAWYTPPTGSDVADRIDEYLLKEMK